jgi:hypothetical protein
MHGGPKRAGILRPSPAVSYSRSRALIGPTHPADVLPPFTPNLGEIYRSSFTTFMQPASLGTILSIVAGLMELYSELLIFAAGVRGWSAVPINSQPSVYGRVGRRGLGINPFLNPLAQPWIYASEWVAWANGYTRARRGSGTVLAWVLRPGVFSF